MGRMDKGRSQDVGSGWCFLSRGKKMKCGLCGQAELVEENCDTPYTYKGRKTMLKDIHGGC